MHYPWPLIAVMTLAMTLSTFGETKEWRPPESPIVLPYDTDFWSVTTSRPKGMSDVAFAVVHRDQQTRVFVRVTKLGPGEKLDDATLDRFGAAFTRGSERNGTKNTVEWTRKDFTGDAGCEFKLIVAAGNPEMFLAGQLTIRGGVLYQIVANGHGSSAEAVESALKVVRGFKYQ